MALRPRVDEEKCVGCGTCKAICPNVFDVVDGKAKVLQSEDCAECDCQSVVNSCPVQAITMEDEE